MGIAETIPGVSGGTLALITGIYARLIAAIRSVDGQFFSHLKNWDFKSLWKHIDGYFLLQLGLGMVLGIGVGIFGIGYFLEKMPPVVWAFFFGLILVSIFLIGSMIKRWSAKNILALIIGALIAFLLTLLPVGSVNDHLLFVFFCGSISICAMILPGVSGSFLLLILGMYQFILHDTLKEGVLENHEFSAVIVLGVFAVGCLFGLLSFSKLIHWALNKYEQITLALLTGFILGSMHKLWPWRWPKTGYDENGQFIEFPTEVSFDKVISEFYLSPMAYETMSGLPAYTILSVVVFFIGILIVYVLSRVQ